VELDGSEVPVPCMCVWNWWTAMSGFRRAGSVGMYLAVT